MKESCLLEVEFHPLCFFGIMYSLMLTVTDDSDSDAGTDVDRNLHNDAYADANSMLSTLTLILMQMLILALTLLLILMLMFVHCYADDNSNITTNGDTYEDPDSYTDADFDSNPVNCTMNMSQL